jgi:hypothetical protein
MERYPRLQKVQRMLCVINRALAQAEQAGEPGIRVFAVWGRSNVGVEVEHGTQRINLAEELGLSGGETVGLFRWAESAGYLRPNYGLGGRDSEAPLGVLEHLETEGYELIGELPTRRSASRLFWTLQSKRYSGIRVSSLRSVNAG